MFKRVNTRSPVWISLYLLHKLVILVTVESDLWEWDTSGPSISQSEPFIKVRAVLKGINTWSPVWILNLKHLIRSVAVISNLWVWDGTGLAISKGEALIKIGAMLESTNWSSNIWALNKSSWLGMKLVVWVAIESNFWIRNTLSSSVCESKSLVEIWTVLKSLRLETWGTWVLILLGKSGSVNELNQG